VIGWSTVLIGSTGEGIGALIVADATTGAVADDGAVATETLAAVAPMTSSLACQQIMLETWWLGGELQPVLAQIEIEKSAVVALQARVAHSFSALAQG
jgi:hypothetical protein